MVSTKSQYLQNKYKTNHRIRCSQNESCVVKSKIKPAHVIRGKDCSSALNALNPLFIFEAWTKTAFSRDVTGTCRRSPGKSTIFE
jgi:hypothetical protein